MSFIDRMMLTRKKEFVKEELNQQEEKSVRDKSSRTDNLLSVKEVSKLQTRSRNALEKKL